MPVCQASPWAVALLLLGAGLCLMLLNSKASAQNFIGDRMKAHACRSIDIRNDVSNFERLRNCTVIEGNLKILLIDNAQASDFDNLTFPNLREITDFFLLFRVSGLRSLRQLFPNLTVIRGAKLFHNYAFVVYEMLSLQEIGLPRLTHIMFGDVRVEKNPDLCYVETVDWELITRNPESGPTIKGNKKTDECPDRCPDRDCPNSRKASGDRNSKLCWSDKDCQKVCSVEKCNGRSCSDTDPSFCCHEQCVGGCSGTRPSDCFACSQIFFDGICTGSCPDNTFMYQGRRCLDYYECKAQTMNVTTATGRTVTLYYKPFQKLCSPECPTGYTANETDIHNCTKCLGRCPKVCVGESIGSIADAQRYDGCTVISGSLEIQITGGNNVVSELHKSLRLVEVITGYLKIVRSYPLMSFDFLPNLRLIEGTILHDDRYSLYALDNPNLENLWTWEGRKENLTIAAGKIFFHFNPKLCVDKIRQLENRTGQGESDEQDVSKHSNGDRVACKVQPMHIWIEFGKHAVIVRWENISNKVEDPRQLLGYTVSYKEAPGSTILTFFDDHDACSTESWKVEDVTANEGGGHRNITHLIPHLKPYTRYGIFVKTSMVAGSKFGAISDIKHFTTSPDTPSNPVELKAWSNASTDLIISWKPPHTPNGLVTHYVVVGELKRDNQDFLDLRNFCTEPVRYVSSSGQPEKATKPAQDVQPELLNITNTCQLPGGKCCACPKDKKELEMEEKKRQSEIQFENYLHNVVYVPRPTDGEGERKKRDLSSRQPFIFGEDDHFHDRLRRYIADKPRSSELVNNSLPTRTKHDKSATDKPLDGAIYIFSQDDGAYNGTFKWTIRNKSTLAVSQLKHFSEYTIKVYACHDQEKNTPLKKLCSSAAIATARTKPADGADNIQQDSISATVNNQTSSSVNIKWKAPLSPNGLVVTFHVEIETQETKVKVAHCLSHKQFLEQNGYTASSLSPGNYTLRVRSTSLSGPGEWSAPVAFLIPEPSRSWGAGVIAGIVLAVICILFIVISFTWYLTKKRRLDVPVNGNGIISVNPEYFSADGVYMPDEWEVARDKVTLLKELGQGSFGMVYEGIARDLVEGKPVAPCAVKTVNESASMRERFEFLNEASVMKTFQCFHVVKLLGVVSKGQPILVVMELMANGDLKSYLRSHRPDEGNPETQPPTLKKIKQMALEIADGMAYLANRKYVHRDLAARNCMVAEDLTVKIGDFGMTRDIYENDYYRKGGKGLLPVRWMAPESLKDGVFTSQSDVWSYGIVLWEMATLASQPYQGLTNEQVLKYVIDGGVIEQPENCPQILYFLMKQCWHYNPKTRLTFIQIIETLIDEASPSFKDFSFYHSPRDQPPPGNYGPSQVAMFEDEEYDDDDEDDDEHGMMNSSPSTPLRTRENSAQPLRTIVATSPPVGPESSGVTAMVAPSGGGGSSDGSKDSRTSTCSANGSVLNGRPGMWAPLTKDTKC